MSSEAKNSTLSDEIDVRQTLRNLRKRLPILIVSILVGAALGFAYTKFVRPTYQARVTIFFPVKPPSLLGIGGSLTDASTAGAAAQLLGGSATPIKIFRGFLESERTLDVVSAGSGLSRHDVDDMRRFDEQTASSTLTVYVTDHDAELAKKVVELHVKALTAINGDLSIGTLDDDVRVLKNMLIAEQARLSAADTRVRLFKQQAVTSPIASVGATTQGMTGVAAATSWAQQLNQLKVKLRGIDATLVKERQSAEQSVKNSPNLPSDLPPARIFRPQLMAAEYDLALREKTHGPDDPVVLDLKDRIALLRKKLQKEMSAYLSSLSKSLVQPGTQTLPTDTGTESANMATKVGVEAQVEALQRLADLAPKESDTLSRLTLEQNIETGKVEQLSAQLTLAKIQASRDPNRWTLLDPPRIDDRPVNKKYSRNVALAAIVGLIAGLWLSARSGAAKA